MFEALAAAPILPGGGVHLFWVDERAVPPTDQRSNYRLVAETLLIPAQVPNENIHRIRAGGALAGRRGSPLRGGDTGLLRPRAGRNAHFDVIHRGIGPDAHTASLFPASRSCDDREGIAAAVHVEKLAEWRITLLPGVLDGRPKHRAAGGRRRQGEAVRATFHEPFEPPALSRPTGFFARPPRHLVSSTRAAARLIGPGLIAG